MEATTTKNGNSNIVWIVIIILVMLLVVGYGGYQIYQNYKALNPGPAKA